MKERSPGVRRRPEFSSVLDVCPLECHLTALHLSFPSCKIGIRTWPPCRVDARTEHSNTHKVPVSSRSMGPPGVCHVGLFSPLSSEDNEPKSPVFNFFLTTELILKILCGIPTLSMSQIKGGLFWLKAERPKAPPSFSLPSVKTPELLE